jgi:hypothetical protein
MQSCETARKCRECADNALALAREARTTREARHYLQLAEIWLRLAARFERYLKQPPRSPEEKLFYLFHETSPPAYPGQDADSGSPTDVRK